MIAFDGMEPTAFLRAIDALLANAGGTLRCPATRLLSSFTPGQMTAVIDKRIGEAPSLVKHAAALLTLPKSVAAGPAKWLDILPSAWTAGLVAATLTHTHASARHRRRHNGVIAVLNDAVVERPALSLSEKERGLVRALATAFASGAVTAEQWADFAALVTWGDGKGTLVPHVAHTGAMGVPDARQVFADALKLRGDTYETALANAASLLVTRATARSTLGDAVQRVLSPGARWFGAADIAASSVLTTTLSPAALIVGHDLASGAPVYYSRNESLFSIGGPGTGKTESLVLPNLLSYPGSAIVLDVKGELWDKTAGYRAKHFGPVYRFAPTDPHGHSHRYNPFDFISTDPEQAATDCEVFSFQIVAPTPNHHDPYWESRGRDFLWAMAMVIALRSRVPNRAMATLMRLLSVPLDVKPTAPDFAGSDTDNLIRGLADMAVALKIPALAEHANAIKGGLGSQRLESVADNARRFLNIFSRSATLRAAMGRSDWHPLDLRRRPGTTIYLCLPGDDLETFAPIVRLILQQHANALLRNFTFRKGEPPITFFLDEFPQLKRMDSILRMVDTGRGAGLRLWFFAQYLGQVRQAYGKQADGLIGSCRVRSFLSPDAEAAEFLKPYLGSTNNLFTGEKHPLAETHELLGSAFGDVNLTLADGPYRFAKQFAWQTMANRMLPPPTVPKLTITP